MTKHLALHETLDLHELLAFKNLCLTKSATMSKLAQDAELQTILDNETHMGVRHIEQIQELLTNRGEQA
jgi:similar to spore coat protein